MSHAAQNRYLWIGVDTGGTFTDLVTFDSQRGEFSYLKVATSSDDPSRAILQAVASLLDGIGASGAAVSFFGHGTTLGTNALLENRLPRTGMITTRGFRDVLELARQRRPHLFNLEVPKPSPIAVRSARLEVGERLSETGEVVQPLDESDVQAAIAELKEQGCESVAVCFLHAYANPDHECQVRDALRSQWPQAYVCISSDVLREMREYERFTTTVVNASLLPVMDRYLENLERGLGEQGVAVEPRIMQSNGGAVAPVTVRQLPVSTFFSGPAAGVTGAVELGRRSASPNLITFDMGGTSTDVCLIHEGEPVMQNERQIAGLPVRIRTIDIHTVGAGGGSIAWIDPGGLLKVGPRSAGAVPGPAGYDRGGVEPTVTDANLVLGRLASDDLLGGQMHCSFERAADAIDRVAAPLGLDRISAAAGIVQIVNVNMMGALRVVSVERGQDPRDFALLAFGGAGPLHAVEVARQLGIGKVIVPAHPGMLSALGLLEADARTDLSLTQIVEADAAAIPALVRGFDELARRRVAWLEDEGLDSADAIIESVVDMRYLGQSFEIGVQVAGGSLDDANLAALVEQFHIRHEQLNGYASREHPTQVVTLRQSVVVPRALINIKPSAAPAVPADPVPIARREVWFEPNGMVSTPVYDRSALAPGTTFEGPAIVVQMDATTLIPPQHRVHVDGFTHLIVETL
ncbi:MAG: N-methylhydantoinase A [Gammaproteobacteria bacterium]